MYFVNSREQREWRREKCKCHNNLPLQSIHGKEESVSQQPLRMISSVAENSPHAVHLHAAVRTISHSRDHMLEFHAAVQMRLARAAPEGKLAGDACARLRNALCICRYLTLSCTPYYCSPLSLHIYHVPQQLPACTTFVAVVNKETLLDPPEQPETGPEINTTPRIQDLLACPTPSSVWTVTSTTQSAATTVRAQHQRDPMSNYNRLGELPTQQRIASHIQGCAKSRD